MRDKVEDKVQYELTDSEKRAMLIVLKLKLCSVKEVLEYYPNPKPAITTLSTVIRVLEHKGFLNHIKVGRGYRYFPTIDISM